MDMAADAPPSGDILAYLARFRSERVHYFPNPGNAGDSIIAAASYQRLEAAGLDYVTPNRRGFDARGKVVIYGGGGNLVGDTTFAHRLVSAIHREVRHLTILPHTVKDVDALLDGFGDNVTVICREAVSYAYVRSRAGRHETLLMDDMAFGLDTRRLLGERTGFSALAAAWQFARGKLFGEESHPPLGALRKAIADRRLTPRADRTLLNAFRLDGEASGIAIPEGNVDLSTVFDFGVAPRAVAMQAARRFAEAIDGFEEIRTNRLHVAITSAVLGKRVQFFPNSYYKCRAVWLQSMRGRFPLVRWMGD
jgi:exopolysaccharide biosynthesis predicted pyruvyltransferase EpsI